MIPASVSDPDLELNFGWPCYEGAPGEPHRLEMFRNSPTCVALVHGKNGGAVLPEFSYAHAEGAAVVLGPLYRGGPYPDEFDGRLFFADYLRDAFWTLEGSPSVNVGTGKGAWRSPVDLELTPTGTLAYASLTTGELVEITYSPPTLLPATLAVSLGGLGILAAAFAAWTLRRRHGTRSAEPPSHWPRRQSPWNLSTLKPSASTRPSHGRSSPSSGDATSGCTPSSTRRGASF